MPAANADASIPRQRPRLAASLLLRRHGADSEVELLFGRRSSNHVFMPRKYVFPGGCVDRGDHYAPLAEEPNETTLAVMTKVMTERRARAAMAAVLRETAEETGLIIGAMGQISRPTASWAPFSRVGMRPNAAPLDVIARAITPPGRPRRFDAWFFTCDEKHVHDSTTLTGNGELEDLRWISISQCRNLDLPVATCYGISEMEAWLKNPARAVRCLRNTRSGPRMTPL